MADAGETPELKGPTVAASANQCLESFQQCLYRASSVHPRELSMVEDQVARFSTWAMGIGVFAPGRASMDHRLRYAPEVQSVVAGLLESLNYRIRTCSGVLGMLDEPPATNARNVAGGLLERSFGDVATEISRLNKISNTIRRASKEAQVLKASNFQIKDDDGNDVEPLLLGHFERYIGDRFPSISKTVQQRLARAMLLRRKRILYRRHRQGNTATLPQKAVLKASVTLPAAQPIVPSAQGNPKQDNGQVAAVPTTTIATSRIESATTLTPNKFKVASSSPSIISASKTVALGNHEALVFPPAPGIAAKRKYEQLKRRRVVDYHNAVSLEETRSEAESKLNELLKSDLQAIGEITCPYCLYALPAQEIFDERKWQNHVKSDLDPYVCLFEDCDQPDELYNHSDGWLSHLHQHSKLWRCSSHRELGPFSTREEYIRHMREAHNTKLSDTQLRVLANRNTRKMVKLFPSCPLCGKDEAEVDGRLEDHIAGHLRSLALRSLPSYEDEISDDAGCGRVSVAASRPQSRSTVKNLEDDKDMLEFGTEHFWDHWKPQLTETNPTNFLGDAHLEFDSSYDDAWKAIVDKLVSRKEFGSLEDDPTLQSMLQRKKGWATVIDDRKKNSSDLPADQEAGNLSKAPLALSEGPVPDSPKPSPQDADVEAIASDRVNLTERLKRGESPTRIPDRHLEPLSHSRPSPTSPRSPRPTSKSSDPLPPADITPDKPRSAEPDDGRLRHGPSIQWPRPALHSGDFTQDPKGETFAQNVVRVRKGMPDEEHPFTPRYINNPAPTYRNRELREAEELEVREMETRKTVLGPDHPDTLTSMANLASTYTNQGRTLVSMANLASTYKSQGRFKEAESLEVQVMETRKTVLGPDCPDTLTSMANLASTYGNQGRLKEAELLEVQVMETRKKVLGPDHPDTLTSMANLALTCQVQGRLKEAESLEVQVMETRMKVLGSTSEITYRIYFYCASYSVDLDLEARSGVMLAGKNVLLTGAGLMNSTDTQAQAVEAFGVRTFAAIEMAANTVTLMGGSIADRCYSCPLIVDLGGKLGNIQGLKGKLTQIRRELNSKADIQRAIRDEERRGALLFPTLPDYDKDISGIASSLEGMVDPSRVVVITGFSELGPCGSSRTHWEMEVNGTLSLEGCIEMAWTMGFIEHRAGVAKDGSQTSDWSDSKTGTPVNDADVFARYMSKILENTGTRKIDPTIYENAYDPENTESLQEAVLQRDLPPFEASSEVAKDLKGGHGDKAKVTHDEAGTCHVQLKSGAVIMAPRASVFNRTVAGQIPARWSAKRHGISDDIIEQVDPVTLFSLVCAVEALLSSGIVDPYEWYQHIHISGLGNYIGSSMGGLSFSRKIHRDRFIDKLVKSDVLQETSTPVGACATSLESLDTGCDLIIANKAKVCIVGGADDFVEDVSFEFGNMKATCETEAEAAQVLTSAELALEMGLPIYGIVAFSNMSADKAGRSVPAPGKGVLTNAREAAIPANRVLHWPSLDLRYRRKMLYRRRQQIADSVRENLTLLEGTLKHLKLQSTGADSFTEHIEEYRRQTAAAIHEDAQRQDAEATFSLGNQFWKRDGMARISPMRCALATWGLTVNDISVASLHGTSTVKNDLNEPSVIEDEMRHMGRREGNLLPGTMLAGADGIKECSVTSFGFGQKVSQALLVHPRYLFGSISKERYTEKLMRLIRPKTPCMTQWFWASVKRLYEVSKTSCDMTSKVK
ncbi:hypothetical protein DL767_006201 [Monosporascus sp. MG133]|nr:hypothetical protein DL767_006201 [Monosporascus sp. MG133]